MAEQEEHKVTINLNYLHILTLIFVVAKLWEKIDWTWFYVLLPSIISVSLGIVVWTIAFIVILVAQSRR